MLLDQAFYSPPQVAKLLAVHPIKVLNWIRAGELRAVNIAQSRDGRARWRISRDDLDAFINLRSSSPPPKRRLRLRKRKDVAHRRYYEE